MLHIRKSHLSSPPLHSSLKYPGLAPENSCAYSVETRTPAMNSVPHRISLHAEILYNFFLQLFESYRGRCCSMCHTVSVLSHSDLSFTLFASKVPSVANRGGIKPSSNSAYHPLTSLQRATSETKKRNESCCRYEVAAKTSSCSRFFFFYVVLTRENARPNCAHFFPVFLEGIAYECTTPKPRQCHCGNDIQPS